MCNVAQACLNDVCRLLHCTYMSWLMQQALCCCCSLRKSLGWGMLYGYPV